MEREFIKYMHVEKYGKDAVQGIELGKCFVFPKLDGTSGVIWNSNNFLQAGSRNRHLSILTDNANFLKTMQADTRYIKLIKNNPALYFYGEWMVKHTIKHYQDTAWNKFYIFDVYDNLNNKWMSYDKYQPILEQHEIEYIPSIIVTNSVTYDGLMSIIDNDSYLLKEGTRGEGIVIKNYDFVNRFGEVIWAKIVRDSFKVQSSLSFPVELNAMEQDIVNKYVNTTLVNKEYAKIVNAEQGWNNKFISRLLSTVYHCLVTEELWDIIKKYKNPVIDFKALQRLCTVQVKLLKAELF